MTLQYIDHFQICYFYSPEKAADSLARKLLEETEFHIQTNGSCTWAVSGGSSIQNIYRALWKHKEELKKYSDNLTVTWVDERYVPHSDKNSNFGNAFDAFWKYFKNARLVPIPYKQNIHQSVEEFRFLLQKNGIGKESLDIVLLGMGADGHTASIFPGTDIVFEEKELVVSCEFTGTDYNRITMTYGLINSTKKLFTYAYGKNKGMIFREMLKSDDKSKFPFLGVRRKNHSFYTDIKFVEQLDNG